MNPRFEQILGAYSKTAKDEKPAYREARRTAYGRDREALIERMARSEALGQDRSPQGVYEEVAVEEYFASQ